MKELANVTARQLEVRLERYTKEIKASYRQAHEAAVLTVKYALICGRNLNEAKRHCVHGSFERYVVETCGCHPVTARRYMRLAEHFPEVQERLGEEAVEQMTATDILEFIKKHVKKTPPKLPNRTEMFDLPADPEEAEPDEPTDLTSEEHEVTMLPKSLITRNTWELRDEIERLLKKKEGLQNEANKLYLEAIGVEMVIRLLEEEIANRSATPPTTSASKDSRPSTPSSESSTS